MEQKAAEVTRVRVELGRDDDVTYQASVAFEKALGEVAITTVADVEDAQAIVVLGGDGSLVHSVHANNFPNVPFRGINTGTLGFFMATENTEDELTRLAQSLRYGDYRVDSLSVLELSTPRYKKLGRAINEVVVKSASGQAINADVQIGEGLFNNMVGDGFIIATPSGSTAYGKSAGGPYIDQELNAYEVVAMYPYYTELDRAAIVPASKKTTITFKNTDKRPFAVNMDGFEIDQLPESAGQQWPVGENELTFSVSEDADLKVIRLDGFDYYKNLSRKLDQLRRP